MGAEPPKNFFCWFIMSVKNFSPLLLCIWCLGPILQVDSAVEASDVANGHLANDENAERNIVERLIDAWDSTGETEENKRNLVLKELKGFRNQVNLFFGCDGMKPAYPPADGAFPKAYGKMILRNEQYSGVNSLAALKVSRTKNVRTGPGFGNLLATYKAAWVDREFINNWNTQFRSGKFTKVRFTFWRREAKTVKPVVDIIFNGKNSNIESWFRKDKVLQIVQGPNVKANLRYNYWSAKGHERGSAVNRHFFVNKNYGGCGKDFGMLCVMDGIDTCRRTWMQGKGWQSFPRFLYSSKTNGCLFKDPNCMKEADVFTISAL